MRTVLRAQILAALLGVGVATAALPAGAAPVVPEGWRVVGHETIGAGLEHYHIAQSDPAQSAHVARLQPGASFVMRSVVSNDAVSGPGQRLERTSSMCARIRCAVAVNADFWLPETQEPVGGVVSLGQLVRSPVSTHHQLVVGQDGRLAAGGLTWKGSLWSTDFRQIDLAAINVARGENQTVLYTPAWGPTTQTNPFGADIVLRVVDPPGPIRLGQTARVQLLEIRDGVQDGQIPPDGAVLSAHGSGADALRDLWARVQSGAASSQALLRLESSAVESVGGTPVLVRDGRPFFSDADSSFVRGRHPRTAVGWNPGGEIFLVTVDGRQPGHSEGVSLAELATLMIGIGATEALNLDGGGSTTFATRGSVVNRPSDRLVRRAGREVLTVEPSFGDVVLANMERPVVVALVIIPRTAVPLAPAPADPLGGLRMPQALALPVHASGDAASAPHGAFPAVVPGTRTSAVPKVPAVAAALAALAAAMAVLTDRRGRAAAQSS